LSQNPLIDRLDEAEGHIKGLLLDTANLATAAVLSTVKYHDPSFDPQKVSEDMDLSGLVMREDIVAAAEDVVIKKVGDDVVFVSGLDNHVVDVGFDVLVDLGFQALLDGLLVGHSCILEAESHGHVAVDAVRCYERRLILFRDLQGYLVIA
jgi:hypothetical protein